MEHYLEGAPEVAEGNSDKAKERVLLLSELVDELMKNSPNEEKVQACMERAGLFYSTDSIQQLDVVLQALQTEVSYHENSR